MGGGEEAVGERTGVGPGDAQVVLDVGGRLLQACTEPGRSVERVKVVTDLDALVEGLEVLEL